MHRVALDYELKREYRTFLQEGNRDRPDSDGRSRRDDEEVERWARGHDLPYFDDHVHFPDVRIEYDDRDNGTEFVSAAMDLWAYTNGVILDFSQRDKPTDNAAIESSNGRFREECSNVHWFASIDDAQQKKDSQALSSST